MTDQAEVLASYSLSCSADEIVMILEKSHGQLSMMWQTLPGRRQIFYFHKFDHNVKSRKIAIYYDTTKGQLDPNYPVFIKLGFRDSLFKGHIIALGSDSSIVKIPHEIQVREFRKIFRAPLNPEEQFIDIKPERMGALKLPLKDISTNGVGFFVSHQHSIHFKTDSLIEVLGFDELGLVKPLLAKVVHLDLYNDLSGWARVGVKMINPISEEIVSKLVKKRVKKPKAQEFIESNVFSEEFQKIVTKEVTKTLSKMKQRPAIAKVLSQLEVSREKDEYLEEHIKVLTLVCTFIARSMNWVSEASMEKFVYASYLHDAPLFTTPKLAKIKSREFEFLREELSPEEIDLFMKSPELSELIAQSDPAVPPDVAMMLLMQKELPSGEGYPYRAKVSKFSPMAALFIVAHDLTDEIMSSEDWSIDRWLKEARPHYRGGPFNKIMDAIANVKSSFKRPA